MWRVRAQCQCGRDLYETCVPPFSGWGTGSFGRSSQEPIEEGSSVRERQTIFKLPDVTNMIAKIKIHESAYDRVSEDQKAIVSLDAFALVNVAANYKVTDQVSIYGRIENLLDENYEEVFGRSSLVK